MSTTTKPKDLTDEVKANMSARELRMWEDISKQVEAAYATARELNRTRYELRRKYQARVKYRKL